MTSAAVPEPRTAAALAARRRKTETPSNGSTRPSPASAVRGPGSALLPSPVARCLPHLPLRQS